MNKKTMLMQFKSLRQEKGKKEQLIRILKKEIVTEINVTKNMTQITAKTGFITVKTVK